MEPTVLPQKDVLIERCLQGDVLGYKELYNRYCKAMYNTCLRILNSTTEAEDVLQESFTEAFRNLDQFGYRSSFGIWLKKICINRSINQVKKRRAIFVEMENMAHDLPADEDHFDNDDDIKLRVKDVMQAMVKLPDGFRTVLSLYLLEGYDHEEIASILKIAESTARTQYMRARQKLLQHLKNEV